MDEAVKRRTTLGLLIDWCKDPYQNAVFSAIARACAERDVNLLCATGGNLDPNDLFWSQRNILYELVGPHNVDGLIAMGGNMGNFIGPARLEQYLQRYLPLQTVCIAYKLKSIPSILVDNQVGLREVIEHLVVAHNYRRIAFIRGPAVNEEAEQRYAVYREVLEKHGIVLDEQLVLQGDFNRLSGFACMRELLARKVRFQAIVAANDLMALGALEVMKAHGIRVPNEVALVGFDDVDEARLAIPQLTTVRQPYHLIGREAVRIALAQIRGEPVPGEIRVPSQVVIRASCGCDSNWQDSEFRAGSVRPEAHREEIKERAIESLESLVDDGIPIDREQAVALFDTVLDEVETKVSGKFVSMLAQVVRADVQDGLGAWNRVIQLVFAILNSWTSLDAERHKRVDTLHRQVRASLGDMAELAQGQQRVRLYWLSMNLSETAKTLMGALTLDAVSSALNAHLTHLNIPACTMSLYVDPNAPQKLSRLEFVYPSNDAPTRSRLGETFETRHLAPAGLLFSDVRQTVVLEPLFFEHDQLGVLTLTMGPEEGLVYEAIRDQVSGAIRGTQLVNRVLEEVKLRQALEKEQAENEMRIAANIQTMILPEQYNVRCLELAALMLPAVHVGGDYYDIQPTSDGCWLGIGDVAGHGLRSGLIMMMLQSAVSSLVKSNPKASPKDVICTANAVLYENIRTRLKCDEHVTLCLLRFDENGLVQFAGAHEELLVLRAKTGHCERFTTDGIWAGILPNLEDATRTQELRLEKNDVLVLYTDGIVEARDVRGRVFSLDRLQKEIEHIGARPAAQICTHIINAVQSWTSSQQDDLTVVVARYMGSG